MAPIASAASSMSSPRSASTVALPGRPRSPIQAPRASPRPRPRRPSLSLPRPPSLSPPLGASATHAFSSQVDFELSTDGGNTFQPGSGHANCVVRVTHTTDTGGKSFFDTEMLQLDLSAAAGDGSVLLRESPTLHST